MPFFEERISDEDFEKYHISDTDHGSEAHIFRKWIVDRQRDIYLRRSWRDWQAPSDEYWWFYWMGHEGKVRCETLHFTAGDTAAPDKKTIRVWMSGALKSFRQDSSIQNDFIEAYRTDSFYKNVIITFEFA